MENKSLRKKSVTLPINIKLNAIKEVKKGTPISVVADNLQVHRTTIKSWLKNEEKITDWSTKNEDIDNKRTRLRKVKNDLVDKAVWLWFVEQRAAGVPVTGFMVQTQALFYYSILGGAEKFEASNGWLSKWQQRHGIKSVKICGEKLSANKEAAENYTSIYTKLIVEKGLTSDQIFNCDETGLNYRSLARNTLASNSESKSTSGVSGFKVNKDRITVMACANSSASLKLPLVVIGKSAKPRTIKNCLKSLPVYYTHQKSAWMSAPIFKEWFYNAFVPEVTKFLEKRKLPPQAILFMDNCASHPHDLKKDGIEVHFFPANTTSLIQPMDQGCLQTLKMHYKKNMMLFIQCLRNQGEKLEVIMKNITLKETIFWLASAWESVKNSTIQKSWNQLLSINSSATNITSNTLVTSTTDTSALHVDVANSNNHTDLPSTEHDHTLIISLNTDEIEIVHQFWQLLKSTDGAEYTDIQLSDVQNWLYSSTLIVPEERLTDEEILDIVQSEASNEEDVCDSTNIEILKENCIEREEAAICLKKVLKFCEENHHCFCDNIPSLKSLQSKIESFKMLTIK